MVARLASTSGCKRTVVTVMDAASEGTNAMYYNVFRGARRKAQSMLLARFKIQENSGNDKNGG
jgi:hypothetical protein